MEQTSLFEVILFWIPEVDTGCRMWKCPKCGGRMVGNSMNWESKNFNPYHFCPYCGQKLHTRTEGER